MATNKSDISLVIAGEAGQGISSVEKLLVNILHQSDYFVFSTKEYMSRVRGGSNSTEIRISPLPVSSFVDRIDLLVLLDTKAFNHVSSRVTDDTIVIGDKKQVSTLSHPHILSFDFLHEAKEIGNKVYANTIAVGLLASLFHISSEHIEDHIKSFFQDKSKKIIEDNIKAIKKGADIAHQQVDSIRIPQIIKTKNKSSGKNRLLLLNGTQAIGLGAIAGGCNFISSYPMSPSTGV